MYSLEDFRSGQIILIDKPLNWSSFDVVNKIRWKIRKSYNIKKIKVGHAGTLDPLATGLLIICTGKMTKQIDTFQGLDKQYTGTITLGSTTPSYDLETKIDKSYSTVHITSDLIQKATKKFVGTIEQLPPVFSAVKKDGKRLYEYARSGTEVEIIPRKVNIHNFEITNIENNILTFKVNCSKGTYIRSLAHDFGKALNSGAHLSSLKRTEIGEFSVEEAISIETFITSF